MQPDPRTRKACNDLQPMTAPLAVVRCPCGAYIPAAGLAVHQRRCEAAR
jgi:hypothetical protein